MIVITIDLSKPGNAIDSLLFWINVVREQIEICKSQITNPKELQKMEKRWEYIWSHHDDRQKVKLSHVPIMVIGTKFDEFANKY
jgi:hypothetical protein